MRGGSHTHEYTPLYNTPTTHHPVSSDTYLPLHYLQLRTLLRTYRLPAIMYAATIRSYAYAIHPRAPIDCVWVLIPI